MVEYFKIGASGALIKTDEEEPGCWIAAFAPTPDELRILSIDHHIAMEDLRAALDLDEVSRFQDEDDYSIAIIDTPVRDRTTHEFGYKTIPFAIFNVGTNVITVCAEERIPLVNALKTMRRLPATSNTDLFSIRILTASSSAYLMALRKINKARLVLANEEKRLSRQQLEDLYALDEALVYFKTSLITNNNVLERELRQMRDASEPTVEAFEDAVIEYRQALETTRIFSEMLDSTIDHFGLMMDHDLNRTMQVVAVVTLVMCIPTAVAGFFGMNVLGIPFDTHPFGFAIVAALTVSATLLITLILKKLRWF